MTPLRSRWYQLGGNAVGERPELISGGYGGISPFDTITQVNS